MPEDQASGEGSQDQWSSGSIMSGWSYHFLGINQLVLWVVNESLLAMNKSTTAHKNGYRDLIWDFCRQAMEELTF